MPETMRAVDVKNGAGPVSDLFINPDIPKPVPKATECLIRVKVFGLNRADTLQREGKYPVPPGVTKVMGLEFSGVVVQVGHGQEEQERHNWKEGDEVFGLTYGGGYAEYVAVSKRMLLRKPSELSWEVCGGTCETWFTALQTLYLVGEYRPETHRSILWHAGASSVSIAGIQLSLHANSTLVPPNPDLPSHSATMPPPKVFVTTRSDEKNEFCIKELGANGAVNTRTHPGVEWASEIKKLNDGNGVDQVVDYIGATYFQGNLEVLALDGRVVQLGTMGGTILSEGVDIAGILRKRLKFIGSTLRSRTPGYQEKIRDLFEEKKVVEGLISGQYSNPIERVFDWEQIGEAHKLLETNQTKGKLVCTIPWS